MADSPDSSVDFIQIPNDPTHLQGSLDQDGYANLNITPNGTEADHGVGGRDATPDTSFEGQTTTRSRTNSQENYDDLKIDPSTVVQGSRGGGLQAEPTLGSPRRSRVALANLATVDVSWTPKSASDLDSPIPRHVRRKSIPITLQKTDTRGRYLLSADDPEIREVIRRGLQREAEGDDKKRRYRFSDLVFTRQFTAFDRQNPATAASPFHGFYTLFWLSIVLMLIKLAASNWKTYGSIFGPNEILAMMFHRDVVVLGITDGIMCASTVFCLGLQKAICAGYLSWDRSGWIIQNIWQTLYLGAIISWTIHRDWPWTHTVFIVIHCITMLMKQHSYGFYNGYLSELYKRRSLLEKKLKNLTESLSDPASATEYTSPTAIASSYFDGQELGSVHRRLHNMHTPISQKLVESQPDFTNLTTGIESGDPLSVDQISSVERILRWEIESLSEELKGKCSVGTNYYPRNLNLKDFAGYITLPTVVYELEYPRQDHIDWYYVAEKTAATFGVLGVMLVVSQAYIYPVVMTTVHMKELGMTLTERLNEFPWVLSDLLFPFMMEYLLAWYVIWECIVSVPLLVPIT
jgi:sterol O-acyltransferase